MLRTPKGLRLQIGFFGKRNAGKSSLFNAFTHQEVSIVSPVPGTTADPVEKAMELHCLGPVLLIDTAGLDDDALLIGDLRQEKSRKIMDRVDMAFVVAEADKWGNFEYSITEELMRRKVAVIAVLNKCDICTVAESLKEDLTEKKIPFVCTDTVTGKGMDLLRSLLVKHAPGEFFSSVRMVGDIIEEGDTVLLVTPIDIEAPKGRLIMPQVQAIRDILDKNCCVIAVKTDMVEKTLANLKTPPALVITDSQVFREVAPLVPVQIPLTSFSILMARMKGDLSLCAAGAARLLKKTPLKKVLIAEACTHHPLQEDIGRVKIPNAIRKMRNRIGNGELPEADIVFSHVQGHDYPDDLSGYDLVIHCGACSFNTGEMRARILKAAEAKVPFSNYGIVLGCCAGILERSLSPFPEALASFRNEMGKKSE
ncbi:MAG: [Lentisphaeria bacterium]|nr:[FeFe] hydrogenase H-cluster maturation GTPase HydF [Lentisphaeria bacterium]